MPIVHIYMFEGRTDDQKSEMVKGVTKAISSAAGHTRLIDDHRHTRHQAVRLGPGRRDGVRRLSAIQS